MKRNLFILFFLLLPAAVFSQTVSQIVKGQVIDEVTGNSLTGATVILKDSDPVIGTTTDPDGNFIFEQVPVGRHSFEIRMLGYETDVVNDILVASGKEVILKISMQEVVMELGSVTITAKRDRDKPLNAMAAVSGKQFTVEETQRYAGGLDDPARLVSSFAGVASSSVNSNGISVRGNSPSSLLWRIEGVEVSSPNHFADLIVSGTGLLTILSSNVLGNSDFFTGAFPAEYGNAGSGVFDINLRNGNASKREYTLQAGLLGLDFGTEGPFKKGKPASYLMNYRYSTLALITEVFKNDMEAIKYQDLSFKVNVPTSKSGTFTFWGVSGLDGINVVAEEQDLWKSIEDRESSQSKVYMYASGLGHRIALKQGVFLNTKIALTGDGLSHKEQRLDDALSEHAISDAKNDNYKLSFHSALTSYLSARHMNKTGISVNNYRYNLDVSYLNQQNEMVQMVDESGNSNLIQAYTQSRFFLTPSLTLNAGLYSHYFRLNDKFSVEPRASLKYKINDRHNVALAYGLHSKIESLPVYFMKDRDGSLMNADLDFMRSHHWVFSYNTMISENIRLGIEPYYQLLTRIPVAPDGYISTINVRKNILFHQDLESTGSGSNIGIDLTLEKFLTNGYYYLLTTSLFDSKYKGGDGIERNTLYNKNYVINALIGKEWQVGRKRNNILSTNIRLNYLGGNRVEAIDPVRSEAIQKVVYGEQNGGLSYAAKHKDIPVVSASFSYRINKPRYSSVWSLQVINALNTKEYGQDIYNYKTNSVETVYNQNMVPNLSYRIEF